MQKQSLNRHKLFLAISAASLSLLSTGTLAQEKIEVPKLEVPAIEAPVLEEMMVTGRQQSGAQSIMQERMEDAFAADLMGADQISRTGDSNVAVALTRIPGVTLNQGKFVYVRGLGERYSSVQLNGAQVPSPELTRNVLPLDIIPSSIVDSLKIQKAYSANLPANFGGGNVDIRTKSVPDEFVFNLTLGTGTNTTNGDSDLSYAGGSKSSGLPKAIDNALDTYQGNINIAGIQRILSTEVDDSVTPEQAAEATRINRDLVLSINRNVDIERKDSPLDQNGALALGNAWEIGDDWTIGSIVNVSHKTEWRNKHQERRGIGAPEADYDSIVRTQEDIKELASFGLGVNYQDMHKLDASYMLINNQTDDAIITYSQDGDTELKEGAQDVIYETRYQDRELEVTQVLGNHQFDQLSGNTLGDISVDWFYSDSSVETDIPGASNITGDNQVDPITGEILSTRITTGSSAQFAYLNLRDEVSSYGWNLKLPLAFESADVELSTGYSYNDKARAYYGYTALIELGSGDYLDRKSVV